MCQSKIRLLLIIFLIANKSAFSKSFLPISTKIMVKFTPIFLILFFTNVLSLKIFYVKHSLKQNPELLNASLSIKNAKSGMLISFCTELKTKIDFIWVNK
jgi:hypothetical protein